MTAMKIGIEGGLGLNNSGQLSCYGNLFRLIGRFYLFQKSVAACRFSVVSMLSQLSFRFYSSQISPSTITRLG